VDPAARSWCVVLMIDSCWHQFNAQQVESRQLRAEDPGEDKEVQVDDY